jgi:hypothetical protein
MANDTRNIGLLAGDRCGDLLAEFLDLMAEHQDPAGVRLQPGPQVNGLARVVRQLAAQFLELRGQGAIGSGSVTRSPVRSNAQPDRGRRGWARQGAPC